MMQAPQLFWDIGTAYDLFISLHMLHHASKYGLRGAWAAGVRSRLPDDAREFLQQAQQLVVGPHHWVYALPEPKNGSAVVTALGNIPPAERLPGLALVPEMPSEMADRLRRVAAHRSWSEDDLECLQAAGEVFSVKPAKTDVVNALEWWSRPDEFGERYLAALRAYQEVFFAEEESRIRPALQDALDRAQSLAGRLALPDLLEELSQGLRFAEPPPVKELVLAPSFWSTPLIVEAKISAERGLILFGARPSDASLIPGEDVPDALYKALKALADPTRLRILRYLAEEPLTPAQLSRRLRLRAPTVVHHLYMLRIAGLVHLTMEQGHERRYAFRRGGLAATLSALTALLSGDHPEAT